MEIVIKIKFEDYQKEKAFFNFMDYENIDYEIKDNGIID